MKILPPFIKFFPFALATNTKELRRESVKVGAFSFLIRRENVVVRVYGIERVNKWGKRG